MAAQQKLEVEVPVNVAEESKNSLLDFGLPPDITLIKKCSLVEMFLPDEKTVANITGERLPGVVSDKDTCIFKSTCLIGGQKQDFRALTANETRDSAKQKFSDWNLNISGGPLASIPTLHTLYGADYPYTLEEISKNPLVPYVFDIWSPVRERIEDVGEDKFKKIHGFDANNFMKMPHSELQKIGATDESKAAGLKVPDWYIVKSDTVGTDRPLEFKGTPVPFDEGKEYFFIYAGRSIYNPQKTEIMYSGIRGVGTQAAGALASGRIQIVRPIKKEEEVVDVEIVPIQGAEAFLEQIEEEINHTKSYRGLEILGYAHAKERMARRVALLDIAFL